MVFGWFAILTAVGLAPAILAILHIPADPKRVVLFGFSTERLLLLSASFCVFVALLVAGVLVLRNERFFRPLENKLFHTAKRKSRTIYTLIGLAIVLWVLLWIPASRYGHLQPYMERTRPLWIWLMVCLVVCITLIRHLYAEVDATRIKLTRSSVLRWLLTSAIFFLVVAGGYFYADPANSSEVLYEAGVPVLNEQIWLALFVGLILWGVENHFNHRLSPPTPVQAQRRETKLDIVLFFAVFLLSAFLWSREPVRPSYFGPGPYPPDHSLFPYSDAAAFDIASQYAYDGQGINAGRGYYRGLYPAFLVYLHTAVGQDYQKLMALQAVLYAVFPAIIYLLVKALSNRPVSVAAALMTAFRGINAIASASWINSDNPKQMMTDFPTAIGISLCCLLVVLAMKKPAWRYFYILLAGGAIGLTSLLRTNALMVIPFMVLLLFIHYWRNFGRWLVMIVFLLAGSLLSVYPWGLRNQNAGMDSIQSMYLGKFRTVIRSRYPRAASPAPASTPLPAISSPSDPDLDKPLDQEEDDPFVVGLDQIFFTELIEENPQLNRAANVVSFVTELTYHNIATSLLIIPTDSYFYRLYPILRLEYPYWDTNWDWSIPAGALPVLILNLGLISLGIAAALRKKAIGLTPAFMFAGYHLANGFARTAGGRYIVPVDWVVVVYYSIGLFAALTWLWQYLSLRGMPKEEPDYLEQPEVPFRLSLAVRQVILAALLTLGIGTVIPASEWLHVREQPLTTPVDWLDELERSAVFHQEFSRTEIENFLQNDAAFISEGRLLYPRFMKADERIFKSRKSDTYRARPFPRLAFELLKHKEVSGMVLEIEESPSNIPSGSRVIVIGCLGERQGDAHLLAIMEGEPRAIWGSRRLDQCKSLSEE